MRKIGLCLAQISNSIDMRHPAMTEASLLRKDEPHPVRALAPGRDFGLGAIMHTLLRLQEATKVSCIHYNKSRLINLEAIAIRIIG